jgi:hypothetical protein
MQHIQRVERMADSANCKQAHMMHHWHNYERSTCCFINTHIMLTTYDRDDHCRCVRAGIKALRGDMSLTDSKNRAWSSVTVSLRILGGGSSEVAARDQSKNLATFCGFESVWSMSASDLRHTVPVATRNAKRTRNGHHELRMQ